MSDPTADDLKKLMAELAAGKVPTDLKDRAQALLDGLNRARVAIVCDGGLVQSVCAEGLVIANDVVLIDYDIDGTLDDLIAVPQPDGGSAEAVVSLREFEAFDADPVNGIGALVAAVAAMPDSGPGPG